MKQEQDVLESISGGLAQKSAPAETRPMKGRRRRVHSALPRVADSRGPVQQRVSARATCPKHAAGGRWGGAGGAGWARTGSGWGVVMVVVVVVL